MLYFSVTISLPNLFDPCPLTLDPKLGVGIDGAVFVLSHTLVHPRILQGQVTDLQTTPVHHHTVLGSEKLKGGKGGYREGVRRRKEQKST